MYRLLYCGIELGTHVSLLTFYNDVYDLTIALACFHWEKHKAELSMSKEHVRHAISPGNLDAIAVTVTRRVLELHQLPLLLIVLRSLTYTQVCTLHCQQ